MNIYEDNVTQVTIWYLQFTYHLSSAEVTAGTYAMWSQSKRQQIVFVRLLSKQANVVIVVVPGNHDPKKYEN